MRDKHIHIAADSALLKKIYRAVDEQLVIDSKRFKALLWTKFIFYTGSVVLLYYLLYKISNPWLFTFCFIVYGFMTLLFAFNFAHDFSHDSIFKNKKWNTFCFIFIYTLNGAHAEAWKQRHIQSHHYAPNVEAYDSDLQISSLIRVIPGSKHLWYHRYQHWYAPLAYSSYSLYWITIKDFVLLFSKDEYGKKDVRYYFSFAAQKIFYGLYLLALPLLFSQQHWFIVLIAFLLMHLFQSLFLLFTFFMTHHVEATSYPKTCSDGFINTSWLMNQVKSSNDMHPFSATTNFIFGGFNNHIAHHLFPHIHHIHYPKLSRILYGILLSNAVQPNHTSYFGGVASHWRLLRKRSLPDLQQL